jgi:hypothetical protein
MLFYNYKEFYVIIITRERALSEKKKDEEAAPASPLSTRTDDIIERDE